MFKAVVVPVVTPVDTQDRVDEEAYRSLLRFLIGAGVHGIVVGGTAAQRSRAAADRFVSVTGMAQETNLSAQQSGGR